MSALYFALAMDCDHLAISLGSVLASIETLNIVVQDAECRLDSGDFLNVMEVGNDTSYTLCQGLITAP